MVNALPMLMVVPLAACAAQPPAKEPLAAPAATTSDGRKITPSPVQPPAEVQPAHRDPGDRVEPAPVSPPPPGKTP